MYKAATDPAKTAPPSACVIRFVKLQPVSFTLDHSLPTGIWTPVPGRVELMFWKTQSMNVRLHRYPRIAGLFLVVQMFSVKTVFIICIEKPSIKMHDATCDLQWVKTLLEISDVEKRDEREPPVDSQMHVWNVQYSIFIVEFRSKIAPADSVAKQLVIFEFIKSTLELVV